MSEVRSNKQMLLNEALRSLVVFIAPLSQAQRVHRRLEAALIDVSTPPTHPRTASRTPAWWLTAAGRMRHRLL